MRVTLHTQDRACRLYTNYVHVYSIGKNSSRKQPFNTNLKHKYKYSQTFIEYNNY